MIAFEIKLPFNAITVFWEIDKSSRFSVKYKSFWAQPQRQDDCLVYLEIRRCCNECQLDNFHSKSQCVKS